MRSLLLALQGCGSVSPFLHIVQAAAGSVLDSGITLNRRTGSSTSCATGGSAPLHDADVPRAIYNISRPHQTPKNYYVFVRWPRTTIPSFHYTRTSILLFCYPSMLPYFHPSISATGCLLRMRTFIDHSPISNI